MTAPIEQAEGMARLGWQTMGTECLLGVMVYIVSPGGHGVHSVSWGHGVLSLSWGSWCTECLLGVTVSSLLVTTIRQSPDGCTVSLGLLVDPVWGRGHLSALLHCCTAALLHCHTGALLQCYTAELLHCYPNAQLHCCDAALLHC